MSYDIRLDRFSDEPLSEQQLEAGFKVLARYGARPFESGKGFSTRWQDGSGFTMFSNSLSERPVRFYALLNPLGDLSQQFCDFLFEFATAIDCAIYPDDNPPLTVIIRPEFVGRLPSAVTAGRVVVAGSGSDLRHALATSYYDWRGMVHDVARHLNGTLRPDPPSNLPG